MKRFYVLGILLLWIFGGFLFGQRYEPMVVEDSHWIGAIIYEPVPMQPETHYYEDYIQGDTIVNGVSYKKVYSRPVQVVNQNGRRYFQPRWYDVLIALLREDTIARKVYALIQKNPNGNLYRLRACPDQEILLYDFSKVKGDTILKCMTPSWTYPIIDTVFRVGKPYTIGQGSPIQQFDTLTKWNLITSAFILEALGGSSGLFYSLELLSSQNYIETYCRGSSCDTLLLPNSSLSISTNLEATYWKISPNPAKDKITISYSGNKNTQVITLQLFDLTGKEVVRSTTSMNSQKKIDLNISLLPVGIYFLEIVEGDQSVRKKIMIRL